ncbi:MAG: hypothetical protein R2762_14210 [Bryobacteraceae bacterium]
MIRRRRTRQRAAASGYMQLESIHQRHMTGFGDGDFIRLRDEFGTIWRGTADIQDDETVRYRFRDDRGRTITGVSDRFGITLRDDRGVTWRGYMY